MTNQRLLYYVPWCIIDGGIIASGLGYNGKDPETGENRFNKILNVHIKEVELGNSPTYMILVRYYLLNINFYISTGTEVFRHG
jgi:hypothetical protein